MSKSSNVGKVMTKVITYLLVISLVLGMAGVIAYFIAKAKGISFYAEYDGTKYYSGVNKSAIYLSDDETHTFAIRSLLGKNVEYSVSVTSVGENNFTFIHNGEFQDFYVEDDAENNDYSKVFELKQNPDGFSLTVPKGKTVEQIVAAKWGGDIQLQSELKKGVSYFVITIKSEGDVLNVWFAIDFAIELDSPTVMF